MNPKRHLHASEAELAATPDLQAILVSDQLSKAFASKQGPVQAVQGITFTVNRGTVVGLLGPNGAGKTTTLRMLTTLLPIDHGSVWIAGWDVSREPGRVRTCIGYVSQLGGADDVLTARENLILQARLYGLSAGEGSDRAQHLISELDLAAYADRAVKTYSGGQRRRLDIALGIIHRPKILFLDEPSTGLDPQSRANLWDHIRRLRAQGMTILVTTHYLDEADALCDQVLIVDHGEIVVQGSPTDLKRQVGGDTLILTWKQADQAQRAGAILRDQLGLNDIAIDHRTARIVVENGAQTLPGLLQLLAAEDLLAESLKLAEPSLDDVFFAATGRSLRESNEGGEN